MIARKLIHEKINYYSLLLIAFSLPFNILFCSYSIAIFVINQIAEGGIVSKIKKAFQNPLALLFLSFIFIHIISLAFTDNMKLGLFDLEKKSSLLVFPILISSISLKPKQIVHILLSFILACLVLSLIFLGNALYKFAIQPDLNHFFLENLSSATGMHRVYASMYFLFCIYALVYLKVNNPIKIKSSRILINVLIIHFTVLIFLLASRTMIFLTCISFIVITIHDIFQTKKIIKGVSALAIFLLLAGTFLFTNEKISNVMSQTFQDLDKGNSDLNTTGPNQRVEIWRAGVQVAIDNLNGVGNGDVEEYLVKQYQSNEFKWGIEYRYNAHNQFLQTWIGVGLLGLLILLAGLCYPAMLAYQNKHYLYLGFIILFTLCCLTESMLCTQKGIVFYSFFNSLLAFHYPGKTT